MQKLTLSQPLYEVSYLQDFGANPEKYAKLGVRGHIGVDYNAGEGDPIKCPVDGTIVFRSDDTVVVLSDTDADGKCLEVAFAHGDNYEVKVGDRVKCGDVLCYQGSTGLTSLYEESNLEWSHIHISVREAKLVAVNRVQKLIWDWRIASPITYEIVEYDQTIDHFRDPNLYWDKVITLVGKAIERKEDDETTEADIVSRCNNPFALRKSPYEDGYIITEGNGRFATFKTYERGWIAGLHQLTLASGGGSAYQKPDFTLYEFFAGRLGSDKERHGGYAPDNENDSLLYATQIKMWVGLRNIDSDPISDWQLTELDWCKKYNDHRFEVYADLTQPLLRPIVAMIKALWSQIMRDKK